MRLFHVLSCAAVLTTASLSLPAQGTDDESEGPLVGAPSGISVGSGTMGPMGPLFPYDLLIKASGMQAAPPGPLPPTSTLPDYRASTFLRGYKPDIDAFSVGFDWILANAKGEVEVPPGHWGGVTFSVTRKTVGRAGEPIQKESIKPDGAAADLFSYILPGSALPPSLVDKTERMQDSTEFNVFAGAPGDIDGHDLYLSMFYAENPGWLSALPAALLTPKLYFSVTTATIAKAGPAMGTTWWGGATKSGAVVFECTWDKMTKTWSVPKPFLTHLDFALMAGDEVDAIAVDRVADYVLFSSDDPSQDPIMFLDTGTDFGTPTPYINKGGPSVSKRIGLIRGDNVDAICALDPGGDPKMQVIMGTPRGFWPLTQIDAQVYRTSTLTGEFFHSFVVGWPGPSVRQPGLAICNLGIIIPQPPWVTITQVQRNVASRFGGDPQECVVKIPPSVSGIGLPVYFTWGVIDASLQNWDVSHQLEIWL